MTWLASSSLHRSRAATAPAAAAATLLALLLAGCATRSEPQAIPPAIPAAYRAAPQPLVQADCGPASCPAPAWSWQPADAVTPPLADGWWRSLGDPLLDALQAELARSNASLEAAQARYRQALAAAEQARAALFPTVGASLSATRSRATASSGGQAASSASTTTRYSAAIPLSWEVDLWGRVRQQVESGRAQAEASAADLAGVRLSQQALLAQQFISLRVADTRIAVLQRLREDDLRTLALTRRRQSAGVVAVSDVDQAQVQLHTTETQLLEAQLTREQLQHSIAVLLGRPPAGLELPPRPLPTPAADTASEGDAGGPAAMSLAAPVAAPAAASAVPAAPAGAPAAAGAPASADPPPLALPAIPVGLPSTLLLRRPDIVAAERQVAAARAQRGAAQAAFFPTLTLGASVGAQALSWSDLLNAPTRVWSLGPTLAATLFDAGARSAQRDQAQAALDAAAATYRQTVLAAFQEVEDQLATLSLLDTSARVQQQSLQAARRTLRAAQARYRAGTASALDLSSAQSAVRSAELDRLSLQGRQLAAAVTLIQALGGGWQAGAP